MSLKTISKVFALATIPVFAGFLMAAQVSADSTCAPLAQGLVLQGNGETGSIAVQPAYDTTTSNIGYQKILFDWFKSDKDKGKTTDQDKGIQDKSKTTDQDKRDLDKSKPSGSDMDKDSSKSLDKGTGTSMDKDSPKSLDNYMDRSMDRDNSLNKDLDLGSLNTQPGVGTTSLTGGNLRYVVDVTVENDFDASTGTGEQNWQPYGEGDRYDLSPSPNTIPNPIPNRDMDKDLGNYSD